MTALHQLANFDSLASSEDCPFFDSTRDLCRAALLTYTPDAKQIFFYCGGDDHDDCALFLAKALRRSSVGGQERGAAAYCEK